MPFKIAKPVAMRNFPLYVCGSSSTEIVEYRPVRTSNLGLDTQNKAPILTFLLQCGSVRILAPISFSKWKSTRETCDSACEMLYKPRRARFLQLGCISPCRDAHLNHVRPTGAISSIGHRSIAPCILGLLKPLRGLRMPAVAAASETGAGGYCLERIGLIDKKTTKHWIQAYIVYRRAVNPPR